MAGGHRDTGCPKRSARRQTAVRPTPLLRPKSAATQQHTATADRCRALSTTISCRLNSAATRTIPATSGSSPANHRTRRTASNRSCISSSARASATGCGARGHRQQLDHRHGRRRLNLHSRLGRRVCAGQRPRPRNPHASRLDMPCGVFAGGGGYSPSPHLSLVKALIVANIAPRRIRGTSRSCAHHDMSAT